MLRAGRSVFPLVIAFAVGLPADAEELFERALEIARSQEARSYELRAATRLARLWRDQGKPAEARVLLQPVYESFIEGFDTADLKDAKAVLRSWGNEGGFTCSDART